MSQFCPEGYYDTDGCVGVEFTEINTKDCCKLTFQMSKMPDRKEVLMFFTGGAAEISYKTLAQLGWNGDTKQPQLANPAGVKQLKCEHYTTPAGITRESWKTAGTAPLSKDRGDRLAAGFRAATAGMAVPGGRPTSPPAARPVGPAPAPTPAPAPAPAPVAAPAPATPPPPADPALKPMDKNGAWDEWCKIAAPKHPDVAKWNATIAEIVKATGKHESQFGVAEWGDVAIAASIPF